MTEIVTSKKDGPKKFKYYDSSSKNAVGAGLDTFPEAAGGKDPHPERGFGAKDTVEPTGTDIGLKDDTALPKSADSAGNQTQTKDAFYQFDFARNDTNFFSNDEYNYKFIYIGYSKDPGKNCQLGPVKVQWSVAYEDKKGWTFTAIEPKLPAENGIFAKKNCETT